MTLQEQIAVMQHFAKGGNIEYIEKGIHSQWTFIANPTWNWNHFNYRIKQPAKTPMWQWIVTHEDGSIVTTQGFYKTEVDAANVLSTRWTILRKAEWTRIEV